MKTRINFAACTLVMLLSACRAPVHVVDQRPDFIPDEQVASALWIAEQSGVRGSAVAVSPRHLLTNAHIWGGGLRWWASELPLNQEIWGYEEGPAHVHTIEGGGKISVVHHKISGRQFRLAASGEESLEYGPDGEATEASIGRSDWALIETDKPFWDLDEVAFIHPAATDPNWVVPEGTELFVLGFSPIFNEEEEDEVSSDEEKSRAHLRFVQSGPYTLRGKVIHDPEDGRAGIQYPPDWPAPTGHSGSGVFLWNADAERLELVGVFYSVTGMAWGLEIGPLKLTASNHAQVLEFVPIAAAMQALNADSD
jgi:hypothetical protein